MASNEEANSNHETTQAPIIKKEFPDWDLPKEIDLISDSGSQEDEVPTISGSGTGPAAHVVPSESTKQTKETEKAGKPNYAGLLAIQHRLADKYRTTNTPKKKQPSPNPEPEPVPDPESESDEADKDKDAMFEQAKRDYNKKKKANKLSMEDEISFMRIESDYMARKRKADADAEYDRSPSASEKADDNEEDGLFVSEEAPRLSELYSDDEANATKTRKRKNDADGGGQPRKRAKPKRNSRSDMTDDDVAAILEEARFQSKVNSRSKGRAKSQNKAASKAKQRKGTQTTNIGSLFRNDVFADTEATADLGPQPTFENTTRRNNALKQLVASVPNEDTDIAKADMKFLEKALKDFTGVGSVRVGSDGKWQVKGLKSELHHFQVIGAAFLRKRENDTNQPRGGILADEMGLGKTIEMLANIVNGRPQTKGRRLKTTLIVCSPALLQQWDTEIRTHCQTRLENKKYGLGTVLACRSGSRLHSNDDLSILESADIVLTTWQEVLRSYPKADPPIDCVTAAQKDAHWQKLWNNERGPLHKMQWLRVVLDEAQAIKNHRSRTSMACRALTAKHYWAISGTPVMNRITEFYAYFKFIREPYSAGSYKIFCNNFCTPNDPNGTERLSVLLKRVMLRRTHIDTFMGSRLVKLPDPKEFTIYLSFNAIETQIYRIVKNRFIQRINKMSRNNELEKQYSNIWTMGLRLRQICGHVLLIQETFMDLCEREDYEKLNHVAHSEEAFADDGAEILYHLRQVLKNSEGLKAVESGLGGGTITEAEAVTAGVLDVGDTEGHTGGKHGLNYHFARYLNNLRQSEKWENLVQRSICCVCRQIPKSPQVTSCFHVYCASCLEDHQHLAAKRGRDRASCAECGEEYVSTKPCDEALTETPKRQTSSNSSGSEPKKKRNKNGKKDEQKEDWLNMKGDVLYSTKTQALKSQVLEWIEEDREVKIIIYSQWRSMLHILGRICVTEGWGYCRYSGDMSHEARANSIEEFRIRDDKQILLASLKAGGLGLNLTMAWKVICLDSWWNSATEQQAFCRVFRINQTRETSMTRIVISNTIDQAMMEMKDRKKLEIDEVMNGSKMREKLSVEDLMRLFGKVKEDENGVPFIFTDEPNDPHLRQANVESDDEMGFMGNEE